MNLNNTKQLPLLKQLKGFTCFNKSECETERKIMTIKVNIFTPQIKKQAQRIAAKSQFFNTGIKAAEKSAITTPPVNPFKSILENIRYKKFKKGIVKTIVPRIKADEAKLDKRINPINEANINEIKKRIDTLIDGFDSKITIKKSLRNNIANCKDPLELYLLLKNDFCKKIMPKKGLLHTLFNSEKQAYRQQKVVEYIEILTPKTKNIDVLKLEQDVRGMGIKWVNFSDDYDYAQITKETIDRLKLTTNLELPSSITVTSSLPNGLKGMHSPNKNGSFDIYLSSFSNYMLFRNTQEKGILLAKQSEEFKNAPVTFKKKLLDGFGRPIASTKYDWHIIIHEIGHKIDGLKLLNRKEQKTAKNISKVAAQKTYKLPLGLEAGPEIIAKAFAGEKLTKEELALFKKLSKKDIDTIITS